MSKQTKILNHLLSGNAITPLEAVGVFSCYRLASVVHRLKKQGFNVITTMKRDANGTPYASYSL